MNWNHDAARHSHMGRALRTAAALACYGCGSLRAFERANRGCLTVLTYHRILPAEGKRAYLNPDLVVTPEALRTHVATLRAHFDVQPLTKALDLWKDRGSGDPPLAALTFDDGYRDNFRYAAPILADLGLHATFFPIVGLVESGELPWYDRLAAAFGAWCQNRSYTDVTNSVQLREWFEVSPTSAHAPTLVRRLIAAAKKLGPVGRRQMLEVFEAQAGHLPEPADIDRIMTWEQLATLAAAGHEIGSHGLTHEILPQLDEPALWQEVAASRRQMQARLGQAVEAFCYPNGEVDATAARAVAAAGYRCAVTTAAGSNTRQQDPYHLRRYFVHEDRLAGLGAKTSRLLLRAQLSGLTARMRPWRAWGAGAA